MRMRGAALLAVVALASCRRASPPAGPAPEAAAPAASPTAPPHVDEGLLGELTREAAARPGGSPSVEAVFAALEAGGLRLARKQQVLATPLEARYCVAAVTERGLNMSVCEFASAQAAEAGRQRSLRMFKAIQRRTLLLRGHTLLTLILPPGDARAAAEGAEAERRFRALSPG